MVKSCSSLHCHEGEENSDSQVSDLGNLMALPTNAERKQRKSN